MCFRFNQFGVGRGLCTTAGGGPGGFLTGGFQKLAGNHRAMAIAMAIVMVMSMAMATAIAMAIAVNSFSNR